MLATLLLSLSVSADPGIRLPELAVPTPMPVPNQPVGQLNAEEYYVIDASIECVVRTHPEGVVKIGKKKGPRDISAKFAGGNGTVEDRSFEGPFIYTVTAEPLKVSTPVTIDIIPLGFKAESEIKTVKLNVGPRPPPIDDEKKKDDGKKEEVKPAPKADKLRIVVVRDAGNMSPDVSLLTTDLPFWKSLTDRGHVWRFYHKDDADGRPYADDAGGKDAVLVYDHANTKTPLKVIPLPAKKAAIDDAVKEFSK